jgi:uncharacterized membrane protein YtjA (UPF0391 family)
MLRAAVAFFILALISIIFGANNVAGISLEIGKTLLLFFLVLSVISFIFALFNNRGSPRSP